MKLIFTFGGSLTPFLISRLFLAVLIWMALLPAATAGWSGLSEQEKRTAFLEFREEAWPLLRKNFMKSDAYLHRWIRAHEYDVHDTMSALQESLKWRSVNKVDDILEEDLTKFDPNNEFPFIADGSVDKLGRPLVIMPVGMYDLRKITLAGRQQIYLRYLVHMTELLETAMYYEVGTAANVTQAFGIMDVHGFSITKTGCLACVETITEALTLLDDHYPNLYYKLYSINTPTLFRSILEMAKMVLSSSTVSAFQIEGSDRNKWSQLLLDEIRADQLPVQYGGSKGKTAHEDKSGQHGFNKGLWRTKTKEYVKRVLEASSAKVFGVERQNGTQKSQDGQHHHHYLKPNVRRSATTKNKGAGICPKYGLRIWTYSFFLYVMCLYMM